MCGIYGIINNNNQYINRNLVSDSAKLMKHRGPNSFGQWGIDGKVELAHLRLSILDLTSDGDQPFISECKNYVIVFNGEIYNYLELREDLKSSGIIFRTTTDTEVLLNAYIFWGTECVTKFNGDWAFVIYNKIDNSLFCSRDRFGVKPFNYAIFHDSFIFSSEIKSIVNYYPNLNEPNYNIISNYCRNSLGAFTEETWFKNILRLKPAHNLLWKDGKVSIYRYWNYPVKVNNDHDFITASEKYKDLFINAVKLRMRSDVPVGTTLSSGIDSTSIVSVLSNSMSIKNHKSFTAVFDDNAFNPLEKNAFKKGTLINEADIVKNISNDLNLDSTFISDGISSLTDQLSDLIYYLESGHSSYATLPLSKVLENAKKSVTVVLEGQGADELLGGYVLKSFPYAIIQSIRKLKFKSAISEFKKFKLNYSLFESFKLYIRLLNNDLIERLYSKLSGKENIYGPLLKKYSRIKDYPDINNNFDDKFNQELFKSHTGGLVNLLHYGDAISMSKSMESRNPFLDVNLVEYVFTLPYDFKIKNGLGKFIHRKSMVNIVPDYILDNPIKFGFITPLSIHFKSYDNDAIKVLLSERTLKRGLFAADGLKKIINNQINGIENNAPLLFRLLSVELWFRCFIDKEINYFNYK